MICEIVAVGTEILLGDILNTNAQYLSRELSDLGISVYFQSVVGDNHDRLVFSIKQALFHTFVNQTFHFTAKCLRQFYNILHTSFVDILLPLLILLNCSKWNPCKFCQFFLT